jgi:hypothetical protein
MSEERGRTAERTTIFYGHTFRESISYLRSSQTIENVGNSSGSSKSIPITESDNLDLIHRAGMPRIDTCP